MLKAEKPNRQFARAELQLCCCGVFPRYDSGLFNKPPLPSLNLSALMTVCRLRAPSELLACPRPQSKLTVVQATRPQTTAAFTPHPDPATTSPFFDGNPQHLPGLYAQINTHRHTGKQSAVNKHTQVHRGRNL